MKKILNILRNEMASSMEILWAVVLAILIFPVFSEAEQIYKTIDENGNVTYTNTVPGAAVPKRIVDSDAEVQRKKLELEQEAILRDRAERDRAQEGARLSAEEEMNQQYEHEKKLQREQAEALAIRQEQERAANAQAEKCQNLLNQISAIDPASAESIGESVVLKGKRRNLVEEYELRCLSAAERGERVQRRNDEATRRQLNQIQQTQREIQNKQRGLGF
jgi:Skp family chaperone for outer membrane proteins